MEANQEIKNLYNEILLRTMVENGIKIIYFINGDFAKHFDRIEQENGKMKVYVKGLQGFFEKPLLHFTVDYANLLAVIEREFFLHIRNSQEEDAQVIFTR